MTSEGDNTNVDHPIHMGDDEDQLEEQERTESGTAPAPAPTTSTNLTSTSTSVSFEFIDHFSLKQPSSTIRSRGVTTRIYAVDNNQLQLEQHSEIVQQEQGQGGKEDDIKHNKNEVKVVTKMKLLGGNNPGLIFLRICYTLVALLMAGFTFVFISNVIVMQTMEIPRNFGMAAGTSLNVPVLVANILSLPLLIYSMSSLMIFCLIFVGDVWNGHVMLRLLLPAQVPRVYLEWYSFILYMFIPMLILCIAAFVGANNTKEIGGLAWWSCMLISFLIFCALVFYNEVKLCLDLTRCCCGQNPNLTNFGLLKQAVLTTLTQRFCGVEERHFLVKRGGRGELTTSILNDNQPIRKHRSLYCRLKSLTSNPFFLPVNPPTRRFSIQELQETVPIVTKQSWSLDKSCCGLRNGRSEFAVNGPDALEPSQRKSAIICSIIGISIGCLVSCAFLYSAGMFTSASRVIVYMVILILIVLPCALSAYRAYQATTLPQTEDEDDNEEPVFQTWTSYTVTKPKEWYCWSRLLVAFVFFFLWPAISLFVNNLPKAGVLFLFTSIFSAARLNLDAASILREHASRISDMNFCEDKSSQKQMISRARAAQVLAKITHSTLYFIAIIGFGFMGGYFVYFSGSSAGSGENSNTQSGKASMRFVDDFYYPPQNNSVLYPQCKLTNDFELPGLDNTYAMDYNFLAGIAYETSDVSSYLLDKWFRQTNFAIEEEDFVAQWRRDSGNSLEQVSFKLFSFSSSPGVGILSIRGTETPMDRLSNAEMYMATVLTQVVRAFMPFSWVWDSIYDDLLVTTNWVASEHLQKTAYYRITTEFVNDLLLNGYTANGKSFQWLRTTGVSLGGGLALITGAQTDAHAFAFSG